MLIVTFMSAFMLMFFDATFKKNFEKTLIRNHIQSFLV